MQLVTVRLVPSDYKERDGHPFDEVLQQPCNMSLMARHEGNMARYSSHDGACAAVRTARMHMRMMYRKDLIALPIQQPRLMFCAYQ